MMSGAAFMLAAVKGELSWQQEHVVCRQCHSAQTRLWHGSSTGLCRIQSRVDTLDS